MLPWPLRVAAESAVLPYMLLAFTRMSLTSTGGSARAHEHPCAVGHAVFGTLQLDRAIDLIVAGRELDVVVELVCYGKLVARERVGHLGPAVASTRVDPVEELPLDAVFTSTGRKVVATFADSSQPGAASQSLSHH